MTSEELDQINLKTFARRIAAKATETDEPWGEHLPDEVWQKYLPQAQRWLEFRVVDRHPGYNHVIVQGTCPVDATVKEVEERFFHEYFGGRSAWAKDGKFGCIIHID